MRKPRSVSCRGLISPANTAVSPAAPSVTCVELDRPHRLVGDLMLGAGDSTSAAATSNPDFIHDDASHHPLRITSRPRDGTAVTVCHNPASALPSSSWIIPSEDRATTGCRHVDAGTAIARSRTRPTSARGRGSAQSCAATSPRRRRARVAGNAARARRGFARAARPSARETLRRRQRESTAPSMRSIAPRAAGTTVGRRCIAR